MSLPQKLLIKIAALICVSVTCLPITTSAIASPPGPTGTGNEDPNALPGKTLKTDNSVEGSGKDTGAPPVNSELLKELEECEKKEAQLMAEFERGLKELERSLEPWRHEQECERLKEEEAAAEAECVRRHKQAIAFEAERARLREEMINANCERIRRAAAEATAAAVERVENAGQEQRQSLKEAGAQMLESLNQQAEKARQQIKDDVKAGDQRLKKTVKLEVAKVDKHGKKAVRDLIEQAKRDRTRLASETAEHRRRISAAGQAGVNRLHKTGSNAV